MSETYNTAGNIDKLPTEHPNTYDGTYFSEYHRAYSAALALAGNAVHPDDLAEGQHYWASSLDGVPLQAATAARHDITQLFEKAGLHDVIHNALDSYPLGNDELARQFEVRQAELRRNERRWAAVAFAGSLGLLGSYVAVRSDPRVATTMLQHAERGATVFMLATVGWGSVAAFGGGLFATCGNHLDRKDEREAYRAGLWRPKQPTEVIPQIHELAPELRSDSITSPALATLED